MTNNSAPAANNSTPLLPIRRNNVPPEILATWCTFNEAFGGGRPKQQQHRIPAEPLTVSDERDSPGSPVFEELFLPPPQKFAAAPHPPIANPTVAELINNNNNNNKRNSVGAGSCCCCSSCSGVSCSSKSTPRSSPVPPTPHPPHLPETVLYGTREAPVLERHCVEGGEFIIAWLSHSNGSSSHSSSSASAGHHRVGAAALVPPPALPVPLHPAAAAAGNNEMQSSTSSANSAGAAAAAAGNQGSLAAAGGSNNSSNRSFINKPARGWLHSDVVIVREGITYFVRVSRLAVNAGLLPTSSRTHAPSPAQPFVVFFWFPPIYPSIRPSIHRRGSFLLCFRFTVNPICVFSAGQWVDPFCFSLLPQSLKCVHLQGPCWPHCSVGCHSLSLSLLPPLLRRTCGRNRSGVAVR